MISLNIWQPCAFSAKNPVAVSCFRFYSPKSTQGKCRSRRENHRESKAKRLKLSAQTNRSRSAWTFGVWNRHWRPEDLGRKTWTTSQTDSMILRKVLLAFERWWWRYLEISIDMKRGGEHFLKIDTSDIARVCPPCQSWPYWNLQSRDPFHLQRPSLHDLSPNTTVHPCNGYSDL